MTSVAIIGGGHIGKTLLADLLFRQAVRADDVRLLLFQRSRPPALAAADGWLGPVEYREQFVGIRTTVTFGPDHIQSLWSAAGRKTLEAADIIIVALPDIPDVRLRCWDWLCDQVDLAGKTIVLMRAGQAGQPVVAHRVRHDARLGRAHIVLVEDAFYGTRAARGRIDAKCKFAVNVATYSRTPDRALARLREVFPTMPGSAAASWPEFNHKRGIDLLFDPLGYIVHVAVALWPANLARTSQGISYNHYVDGVDPELAPVLDAQDKERVLLASDYGVAAETFPQILNRQYQLPILSDFFSMMQSTRLIYRSMSASSIPELQKSRYIHEDIPALRTINWLADCAGRDLPATRALMQSLPGRLQSVGIDVGIVGSYERELAKIDPAPDEIAHLLTQPFRDEWAVQADVPRQSMFNLKPVASE